MNRRPALAITIAGFVLHAVIGVFPFAFTGLLAPPWAVAAVFAWWLVLLAVAVKLARSDQRRWRVVLVPAVALLGWFAVLTVGDVFLGWTA